MFQCPEGVQFCGHPLYREISPEDAVSIQQTLELIGDHPPKCFCCETKALATKAHRVDWTRLLQRTRQSITEMLSWKAPSNSLTGQTSQSVPHQRYTPGTTATTSAFAATAHDSTATSLSHYPGRCSATPVGAHTGSTDTTSISRHGDPLWVVFGIKDRYEYDEIENIEASNLHNDPSLFKELKKRYAKHCWFFQRWLSPYRFRNCKFVQVIIPFDNIGSVLTVLV